jgi:hypothetical protein
VAHMGDPPHAPDATLARVPTQGFCPDTEEVTGSNPVSPTSITPSHLQFLNVGPLTVRCLCNHLMLHISAYA